MTFLDVSTEIELSSMIRCHSSISIVYKSSKGGRKESDTHSGKCRKMFVVKLFGGSYGSFGSTKKLEDLEVLSSPPLSELHRKLRGQPWLDSVSNWIDYLLGLDNIKSTILFSSHSLKRFVLLSCKLRSFHDLYGWFSIRAILKFLISETCRIQCIILNKLTTSMCISLPFIESICCTILFPKT